MKKMYCISYDLIGEKDYTSLIDAIKNMGPWWHQTGSVWFVISEKTSIQIRDFLKTLIDKDDKIFVVRINSQDWAGTGFTPAEYQWLHDRMKELNITTI